MGRRFVGAGALAGLLLAVGAVRPTGDGRPAAPAVAVPSEPGGLLRPGIPGAGSMAATIAALQERLRQAPTDWRAHAALGRAYVQQARISGDPGLYPRAEEALRRSLVLRREGNVDALQGMGSLALARHDFEQGLAWGRRAVAANPDGAVGYGVLGDALVELGRYGAAFQAFQRMVDLRPDLSSYARASYARELQGDVGGAARLMNLAGAAAGSPDDAAWTSFQLGELYWSTGRVDDAEAAYRQAARLAPSFVPPRAGLAKVSWARGRVGRAVRLLRWVVARYPAPEHVAALGDLLASTGRGQLAAEQYDLVRAEQALLRAGGVNIDVELALFDADHGRAISALRAARAGWSKRKSIHAADAMAWALFANGRYRQASRYSSLSLRLGTRNALFLFHAGMIRLRLGNDVRAHRLLAEALRTNPHFSILHASVARRALARLEARA